jgi:hypothetical protein
LAIIGVVAALTIPAVITKVAKEQYVVGLKKAYNTLKSVERESIQEHGEISSWSDWDTLSKTQAAEKYFTPYFDIMKNCGMTTDEGCFNSDMKSMNNVVMDFYNSTSVYRFITSDGMLWSFGKPGLAPPARMGYFIVDVNGKKAPNIVGRDSFAFNIHKNKGLVPQGVYLTDDENTPLTNEQRDAASGEGCSTAGGEGWNCTAKVLSENAMNY